MNTKKHFFVFSFLLLVACESPCDRKMHIDGPEYSSLYIYKFQEGKDYSDHVIIISPLREEDSSAYYITGYKPIKLHGGYYLGGNIPALRGPEDMIHYLTLTYSDLENGNAPEDWFNHWWDYRIIPEECIFERFYYRGRCHCMDARCYYKNDSLYNFRIRLKVPIIDDVHTDTAKINKMIEKNCLIGFGGWMAPHYCNDCVKEQ